MNTVFRRAAVQNRLAFTGRNQKSKRVAGKMSDALLSAVIARRSYLRSLLVCSASVDAYEDIKACERLILMLEPSFSPLALRATIADPLPVLQRMQASLGQFLLVAPKAEPAAH